MSEQDKKAFAWATHHDEPMLFPSYAEALSYCDDDELPIPLYTVPPAQPVQSDPLQEAMKQPGVMQFENARRIAQPVQSNSLREVMKQPEEFNAQQFASLWLSYCDKKIEVEDLKAVNEQLLEALKVVQPGLRPNRERRLIVDAAIAAAEAAKGV